MKQPYQEQYDESIIVYGLPWKEILIGKLKKQAQLATILTTLSVAELVTFSIGLNKLDEYLANNGYHINYSIVPLKFELGAKKANTENQKQIEAIDDLIE